VLVELSFDITVLSVLERALPLGPIHWRETGGGLVVLCESTILALQVRVWSSPAVAEKLGWPIEM